jgi:ABC-2 type transport system ATP-binding protein
MIREIGQERTVLLSTHILSEAQQVCDRVLIINKGRIVAEDSPERLQARISGAQRVTIRVAHDGDGLESLVGSVPGVLRVVSLDENGIEFETTPGQDTRPAVARAIVEAGYDLLEMRPLGISLEEIFLQLTRDEPKPPEMAEESTILDDNELEEDEPGEEG